VSNPSRTTSTVWDVAPGESLDISPGVSVRVVHKSGRRARLLVEAPKDFRISHVRDETQEENRNGAAPSLVT